MDSILRLPQTHTRVGKYCKKNYIRCLQFSHNQKHRMNSTTRESWKELKIPGTKIPLYTKKNMTVTQEVTKYESLPLNVEQYIFIKISVYIFTIFMNIDLHKNIKTGFF